MLTKHRPTIIAIEITPFTNKFSSIDTSFNVLSDDYGGEIESSSLKQSNEITKSTTVWSDIIREGKTDVNVDKKWGELKGLSSSNIIGAKIIGNYINYMDMLVKKHESCSRKLVGNIIVLDSYDGAEHINNRKKESTLYHTAPRCFVTLLYIVVILQV